jgi:hypothetical protein
MRDKHSTTNSDLPQCIGGALGNTNLQHAGEGRRRKAATWINHCLGNPLARLQGLAREHTQWFGSLALFVKMPPMIEISMIKMSYMPCIGKAGLCGQHGIKHN